MKRALGAIFLQLIIDVVFVVGWVSQSGKDKGTAYEASLKAGDMVNNYGL